MQFFCNTQRSQPQIIKAQSLVILRSAYKIRPLPITNCPKRKVHCINRLQINCISLQHNLLFLLKGGAHRNNSCGRLCDREYEDLSGLLIEQKNKFGSTPLFNIPPAPPVTSATTRPKLGPPPPTSFRYHSYIT